MVRKQHTHNNNGGSNMKKTEQQTGIHPSSITKPVRDFIVSDMVKCYSFEDEEFVNGYQRIKETKVTVMIGDSVQTIWYFITAKENFGKVGYIIKSWKDQLDVQVSKEDGNTAYLMIMYRAKKIKGAKVIVETI
jgi:hypothetical protein